MLRILLYRGPYSEHLYDKYPLKGDYNHIMYSNVQEIS